MTDMERIKLVNELVNKAFELGMELRAEAEREVNGVEKKEEIGNKLFKETWELKEKLIEEITA